MKTRLKNTRFLVIVLLLAASSLWAQTTPSAKPAATTQEKTAASSAAPITLQAPASWKDLKYPTLTFTPPRAEKYRHVLSNGVVAFLVEDHDLPLINVSIIVKAGSYLDPAGKEGLASLVGSQIRAGGTTTRKAEQFDEDADFLATPISTSIGETQGNATMNTLTKNLDESFKLFFELIQHPGFQADRLTLAKSQILQQMERRNDNTDVIEEREWDRLLYGDSFFENKYSTKASIDSITRDDLIAFHKKYFQPGDFTLAVSGDFKTDEMIKKLEASMQGWEVSSEKIPDVPKPVFTPVPGIYVVNKASVNQGRVRIGHLGDMRDNPDNYALSVMNSILGGGGFTSRIVSRVRSDEGLAYSAGSSFGMGVYFPGPFMGYFQSKSPSCAQGGQIVIDEINRIRTTKVSKEELDTAINYFIETFPRSFATAQQIAGTFANDEFTHRPKNYWNTYRDHIKAVTADDVQRVAQKYLHPDQLIVLMVGNVDDMMKGNPDKPQFAIGKLTTDGKIHNIPLPDPLTMTYPKAQ
ncbi:MAG: pitrilysin family protein [Acidobacteriia bacterium]|nr:pitrilysin family protein [Terriglobia bacterium]